MQREQPGLELRDARGVYGVKGRLRATQEIAESVEQVLLAADAPCRARLWPEVFFEVLLDRPPQGHLGPSGERSGNSAVKKLLPEPSFERLGLLSVPCPGRTVDSSAQHLELDVVDAVRVLLDSHVFRVGEGRPHKNPTRQLRAPAPP